MTAATLHIGDTLAVLPTLPAGSVDLVCTSPPFLALRSYLAADHPAKALEHGSEPTPAAFLATLLDVTAQLDRVLAPHGSLCVELGDTFAGSHGAGGDYREGGMREGQPVWKQQPGMSGGGRRNKPLDAAMGLIGTSSGERAKAGGWPPDKSLCGIPAAYQLSLAYGRNILAQPLSAVEALDQIDRYVAAGVTHQEAVGLVRAWVTAANPGRHIREFAPWRVRNLVAWVRPNPPVGSLGDKWRPATSYITIATRARDRWWDDIPTRRPHKEGSDKPRKPRASVNPSHGWQDDKADADLNPTGAPLLDWWEIAPAGFTSNNGQHFATFPPALVEPLVEAMCPRRVCTRCGTPSRRTFDENPAYEGRAGGPTNRNAEQGAGLAGFPHKAYAPPKWTPVGWSTCGCPGADGIRDDGYHTGPAWRPGMVLDPYCGTATTLAVATGHGRDAVGIDLNPANAALAEERCGMFLTVVEAANEGAA